MEAYVGAPCAVPVYSDPSFIATEVFDIILDPLECFDLVEHSVITRKIWRTCTQET